MHGMNKNSSASFQEKNIQAEEIKVLFLDRVMQKTNQIGKSSV